MAVSHSVPQRPNEERDPQQTSWKQIRRGQEDLAQKNLLSTGGGVFNHHIYDDSMHRDSRAKGGGLVTHLRGHGLMLSFRLGKSSRAPVAVATASQVVCWCLSQPALQSTLLWTSKIKTSAAHATAAHVFHGV